MIRIRGKEREVVMLVTGCDESGDQITSVGRISLTFAFDVMRIDSEAHASPDPSFRIQNRGGLPALSDPPRAPLGDDLGWPPAPLVAHRSRLLPPWLSWAGLLIALVLLFSIPLLGFGPLVVALWVLATSIVLVLRWPKAG